MSKSESNWMKENITTPARKAARATWEAVFLMGGVGLAIYVGNKLWAAGAAGNTLGAEMLVAGLVLGAWFVKLRK